jgi:hypothetical protein
LEYVLTCLAIRRGATGTCTVCVESAGASLRVGNRE